MVGIQKTRTFDEWLTALGDRDARLKILARIDRLAAGNRGKMRVLTGGISEMKIDFGPGYRVYFWQRGTQLVLLLCGGVKNTQDKDIKRAMEMRNAIKTLEDTQHGARKKK